MVSAAGERTSGEESSCEACKVRLRSVMCAPAAEHWRVRQGSEQLAPEATGKQCKVRVFSFFPLAETFISSAGFFQLACFGGPQGSVPIRRSGKLEPCKVRP